MDETRFKFEDFIKEIKKGTYKLPASTMSFQVPTRKVSSFPTRLISSNNADYTVYDYKAKAVWVELLNLFKDSGLAITKKITKLTKPYRVRRRSEVQYYTDDYLFLMIEDTNCFCDKIIASDKLFINLQVSHITKNDPQLHISISDELHAKFEYPQNSVTKYNAVRYIINYVPRSICAIDHYNSYLKGKNEYTEFETDGMLDLTRIFDVTKSYFEERDKREKLQGKSNMKHKLYVRKIFSQLDMALRANGFLTNKDSDDFLRNEQIIWSDEGSKKISPGIYLYPRTNIKASIMLETCGPDGINFPSPTYMMRLGIQCSYETIPSYSSINQLTIQRPLYDNATGTVNDLIDVSKILEKLMNTHY